MHVHVEGVEELLKELGLGSRVEKNLDIVRQLVNRALELEKRSVGIRHGPKMQRPVLNTEDF